MRPKSPEPKTEDELEPGELDKGDEEEDKEDQQRMEIEEELKYAITQAKEKELNLDKVERARQRIRQNNLIKKDWAAQRQSDLEARHQLNLNEQEDPTTAQGILTKDNGPRESLTESRPKVLTPGIPPDGSSGTPACCGHTGHQGSPTQTGPLTQREPDRDASTVRLREKAGITKDGEKIMVIGSPTPNSYGYGKAKTEDEWYHERNTYDRDWYGQAEDEWYHERNTYDRDWYGQAGTIDHRRYSTPYFLNDEREDEQLPRRHSRWNPPYRSSYPTSREGSRT